MIPFDPADYGDGCAPFYDQLYPAVESGLLAALADLSRGGPALDLGVGTGRVALPLSRCGVAVHGVEASARMIAALHSRRGGASIPIVRGDFASVPFGSRYQLIYSLVSTFFLLPSLELQQACLRNIARHLLPGGMFLSEAFDAPDAAPALVSAEVPIRTVWGTGTYRVTTLCTPLPRLDAMAAASGLRLRERWSGWHRTPFGFGDRRHISVYALDAAASQR